MAAAGHQPEVNADSSVTDGLLQVPLCPFPYFYMKHPHIRYLFFNQENFLSLLLDSFSFLLVNKMMAVALTDQ